MLLGDQVAVVLAHELHEAAVHAEDDEHLKLRIVEECVALGEHVVGAAEDALTERFLFESTELAGRARRPWDGDSLRCTDGDVGSPNSPETGLGFAWVWKDIRGY